MATIATAKKVYAAKVCGGFLGIPTAGCEKAFDKLIENMAAGYEALAGAPAVSEAPETTEMPEQPPE